MRFSWFRGRGNFRGCDEVCNENWDGKRSHVDPAHGNFSPETGFYVGTGIAGSSLVNPPVTERQNVCFGSRFVILFRFVDGRERGARRFAMGDLKRIGRINMGKIHIPKRVPAGLIGDLLQRGGRLLRGETPVERIAVDEVGHRAGGNPVVSGFAGSGDGAGKDDIVAEVSAVVEPGEDPIGFKSESEKADSHTVGRVSRDGVTVFPVFGRGERLTGNRSVATLRAKSIQHYNP